MGSGSAKELAAVLHDPSDANVSILKQVFDKSDRDHSNSVDTTEWAKYLTDPLWSALVQQPAEELAASEKEEVNHDLAGSGRMGKVAASMTAMAVKSSLINSQPKDKKKWVLDQFRLADVEHKGSVSFENFLAYLRGPGKIEYERQREALIKEYSTYGSEVHAVNRGSRLALPTAEISPEVKKGEEPHPEAPAGEPATPVPTGAVELTVKTLTGKTIMVQSQFEWTVLKLKETIQEKEGIPPPQQRLVFAGKQLEDGIILKDAGITRPSTLYLILRLKE